MPPYANSFFFALGTRDSVYSKLGARILFTRVFLGWAYNVAATHGNEEQAGRGWKFWTCHVAGTRSFRVPTLRHKRAMRYCWAKGSDASITLYTPLYTTLYNAPRLDKLQRRACIYTERKILQFL